MKNAAQLTIILFILISCAHKKSVNTPTPTGPSPVIQNKPKEMGKTRAVFHVIAPLGVELILLNVKGQKEEIVLMDKTLSQLELEPGFWQVSGFVLDGIRFNIMNTGKQFIFKLKKNQSTYVGSYIFQCPKVNGTYLGDMKKMNFFNRYPFRSEKRLCELVVGSDFDKVKQVWKNIDKTKLRPLSLGF
jgi:hypothetical protein